MAEGAFLFKAVIFDLDGVITKTALVHAVAWKEMFDEYLLKRQERDGEPFREFTHEKDYLPYVDGKPRYEGVRSFLESRGIDMPFGGQEDSPDQETVCGLGNRKNLKFQEVLFKQGAQTYPSTLRLINELKAQGVHIGVASSSMNCRAVLESVGIEGLFETRVDGVVSAEAGLKGKPHSDIFVVAARNMGARPEESIVVEDAASGVQAGRNGAFGLVIGLARENNERELRENGADIVINDFEGVSAQKVNIWFSEKWHNRRSGDDFRAF